ncbi:uncharacterized protein K460DRAFT_366449 [Cucurbitaria berberidis CBS 394.84]|uniref:N-acetyltransferase domain-containing protein n=1 Tax=Cucurbitaria berberidis CBS 394.84 TaxID=1168544 RepID=A0A9P4GHV7_9PLEO|nr:uncharacterized protein K460DRAFT_366449 [Cucurbitaria berberidis CBS 394.84]KAF1845592.1 hypothetical protein K460DRAFT_366449 [Cucurbitaria berberidis CBS 394.84]
MPLEIHPVQESDFADFVRIQMAAFAGGGGITSLLTPTPLPFDYVQKSIDKHIKSWRDEPDVHYLKVIDTDLGGKMIAGGKWRVNEKERTEEQIQSMLPIPGIDEEGRPGAQDFMWFLTRARREYMGRKPFYFLHILVTDPEHHRRGAGAMLIAWGLKKADNAQLPSYLESSPMGRPLYARMGFKPRYEEIWDLRKYGLQGMDKSTVMIREPSL